MIVTGIAVIAGGFFVRTEVFAAILSVVGILGMIAGVAISAIGIFILGHDRGWWGQTLEFNQSRGQGVPAQPPEYSPGLQAEAAVHEQPPPMGVGAPQYPEGVVAPQYTENPTVFNVAGPPEAAIPASPPLPRPSNFQVSTAMLILGILPIALLLLSALPVTPWISSEGGLGWPGEEYSEQLSIWGTIDHLRGEYRTGFGRFRVDYPWNVAFAAYLLSIAGTVATAVALLLYRQPDPYIRPGDQQALGNRLDVFLVSSILLCLITLSLLVFMWYETQQLAYRLGYYSDLSLGPTLCLLAAFSLIGYLCAMIANPTFRSRFGSINLATFVSFSGRITRPTFAIIMVPMMLTHVLSYLLLVYFDNLFTTDRVFTALSDIPSLVTLCWQIVTTWIWIAICVKRYHDRDMSGWWSLLILGLTVAVVMISFVRFFVGSGLFAGPVPIAQILVQTALLVAVMSGLLFKEGTRGVNQHGPPSTGNRHRLTARCCDMSETEHTTRHTCKRFDAHRTNSTYA